MPILLSVSLAADLKDSAKGLPTRKVMSFKGMGQKVMAQQQINETLPSLFLDNYDFIHRCHFIIKNNPQTIDATHTCD